MNGSLPKQVRIESLMRMTRHAIVATAAKDDDGRPVVDPAEVLEALTACIAFVCACTKPSPTDVRKASESIAKIFRVTTKKMMETPNHAALKDATVIHYKPKPPEDL